MFLNIYECICITILGKAIELKKSFVLTILKKEEAEMLLGSGHLVGWPKQRSWEISTLFLHFAVLFLLLLSEVGRSEKCMLSGHEEGQRNTFCLFPYILLRDNSILNYNKILYNKNQCKRREFV